MFTVPGPLSVTLIAGDDGGAGDEGGAPGVDEYKVMMMLCEAEGLVTLVAVIVTFVDVGMIAGAE
jgi:hypothetical protein